MSAPLSQATDAVTAARAAILTARHAVRHATVTTREAARMDGLLVEIRECVSDAAGLLSDLAVALSFSCATALLPRPVQPPAQEVAQCLHEAGVRVANGGQQPWQQAREIWQHHVRAPQVRR